MQHRLPPQIERLAMLTVAIVAAYFIARFFLVPSSFGQYGWYRGAVFKDYAALPIQYAGRAACAECHDEETAKIAKGNHKSLSCEACHGPMNAHVLDISLPVSKIRDGYFCNRCHEANPSRPETLKQIVVAKHEEGQVCVKCHLSHEPREKLVTGNKKEPPKGTP